MKPVDRFCELRLTELLSDLENVRHAREWLKEARHVVSDRFKDIGRGKWAT